MKTPTWWVSPRPYQFVIAGCLQFLLLTTIAMFFYPGSTTGNDNTTRYIFSQNFFSDLGVTTTYNGQSNTIGAILFFIALATAGIAIITFFLALPHLFQNRNHWRWLTILGSLAGIISGLGYIGVALTPADLFLNLHINAVRTAFVFFFFAVLCYLPPLWQNPSFPRFYAYIFATFALALITYIWL
ncbi:MAG TPA: hypothetical protein VLL52_10615, partial [Anaerolineae bacterium]|nr:hypothetical protein [Anaerolineae bacterium]